MSLLLRRCARCFIERNLLIKEQLFFVSQKFDVPLRASTTKSKFQPGKPRNLLELYESNPSWVSKQRGKEGKALQSGIELAAGKELSDEKLPATGPKTAKPFPVILAAKGEWGKKSLRPGLVGTKLGMTSLWDKNGESLPVTLIQIKECQIVRVHVSHEDGGADRSTYVEVGAVTQNDLTKVREHVFAMYVQNGVTPKKYLKPFKVSKDALLPAGTPLHAAHFRPGQYVKIMAISQTKGFQGVMKRWGMKGQPASHGVSKTHRKMGATGGGQDPGRVFPGKKMPGHMGGKRVCFPSLKVLRINTVHDVLYVKGKVPGFVGTWVKISDSMYQKNRPPLPFPTYFPEEEDKLPEDIYDESVHPPSQCSLEFSEMES